MWEALERRSNQKPKLLLALATDSLDDLRHKLEFAAETLSRSPQAVIDDSRGIYLYPESREAE